MSGSWSGRVEAGLPLKAADVGVALRDLGGALHTVRAAIVELDARDADLADRLEASEAKLANLLGRLGEAETAKPAKGGKTPGGPS